MKEIKFRAWDKLSNPPRMLDSIECGGFAIEDLTTCELEIMQYTGLKDKNGKEIYEGDIYKYKSEIDVFNSIEDFYFDELIEYRVTEGEIIGNKFENPELLEAKCT